MAPTSSQKDMRHDYSAPRNTFPEIVESGCCSFTMAGSILNCSLRAERAKTRAVSITSIICKFMESIVRDKLIRHMICCKPNNLYGNMDRNDGKSHPIDIISTDFAKAFDRVPHQRLSRKIRSNGIIGQTLDSRKAFLTGRSRRVRVEQEF